MKIDVKVPKPRAKWLNDLLRTKRNERHADFRRKTRQDLKKELRDSVRDSED